MGFPTKNDHFGVCWGYHHFRKHPYPRSSNLLSMKPTATRISQKDILDRLPTHHFSGADFLHLVSGRVSSFSTKMVGYFVGRYSERYVLNFGGIFTLSTSG